MMCGIKACLIAQGSGIADGVKCTETPAGQLESKEPAADEPAENTLAIEAPTQAPQSKTGIT